MSGPASSPLQPLAWDPVPAQQPARTRTARRFAIVLGVALLLAGAVVVYLVHATDAWHSTADQWQALASTHGTQVAEKQADLDAANGELTSTRDELSTAQARITELADEKAQLGDATAESKQLAAYQARVSKAAATVATSLASCVTAQNQLIGYLDEKDKYDATSLATFATQVQQLCAQATSANDALQRELTQ